MISWTKQAPFAPGELLGQGGLLLASLSLCSPLKWGKGDPTALLKGKWEVLLLEEEKLDLGGSKS